MINFKEKIGFILRELYNFFFSTLAFCRDEYIVEGIVIYKHTSIVSLNQN